MQKILLTAVFFLVSAHLCLAAEPPVSGMGGTAINVSDLARSEAYYTEIIGMTVVNRLTIPLGEEIILRVDGQEGGPSLILAKLDMPVRPGKETFGRIIFQAPDAEATAQRVKAAGYAVEKIDSGTPGLTIYFVSDPDGYQLELLTFAPAQ